MGFAMAVENATYSREQIQQAVVAAVAALRDLRAKTVEIVPERSAARRKIVQELDEALRATEIAVSASSQPARVGDDPPALWRRALAVADSAVQRTGRFIAEVRDASAEKLARFWRVNVEAARFVKEKVVSVLHATWEVAKLSLKTAGIMLAGLVAATGFYAIGGIIVLGLIAWAYFKPKGT